jgi:hypothetical protein
MLPAAGTAETSRQQKPGLQPRHQDGGRVLLWAILFGSKLGVPEIVALAFGDRVSLGGFFSVTARDGPAGSLLSERGY